jgi:hypothetical protein
MALPWVSHNKALPLPVKLQKLGKTLSKGNSFFSNF